MPSTAWLTRSALVPVFLAAGTGLAFGQPADDVRYYEATTADGNPAPKPDPWCELAKFGSRSLWACPTMSAMPGHGGGSEGRGSGGGGGGGGMGGGSSGGGMDGGGDGGGMDN